jgi:outer membrane beta-barrel protein
MKIWLGLFLMAISSLTLAQGRDLFDLPKPEPVMNKLHLNKNDLSVFAGYFPMNSFAKYYMIGGAYTRYFGDTHGWEVLNAQMASEQRTSLKSDLLNPANGYTNISNGTARPILAKDFATLQYLLSTSYVYSPFYMKSLFFNSSQVAMKLSFLLGAGMAQFQTVSATTVNAAVLQKFIFASGNALSFEARYLAFLLKDDTIRDNIALNFAYVWSWGKY